MHHFNTTLALHAGKGMRDSLVGEVSAMAAVYVIAAGATTFTHEDKPIGRTGVLVTVNRALGEQSAWDEVEIIGTIRTAFDTLLGLVREQFGDDAVQAAMYRTSVDDDPNPTLHIIDPDPDAPGTSGYTH